MAKAALADPDPWHGLATYMEKVLVLQLRDKGLAQILTGDHLRVHQHDWKKDILAPKVNAIAARAKNAGVIRDDIEGTDLIFLQVASTRSSIVPATPPDLCRRYLHLVLDGSTKPARRCCSAGAGAVDRGNPSGHGQATHKDTSAGGCAIAMRSNVEADHGGQAHSPNPPIRSRSPPSWQG
jgi:hypothetical protein